MVSRFTHFIARTGLICLCLCIVSSATAALADDSDWTEPTLYKSVGKADLTAGDKIYRYIIEGVKFDTENFALTHFGEDNLKRMTVRQEDHNVVSIKSAGDFGAMYYAYNIGGGWIVAIKPGSIPLVYNHAQNNDNQNDDPLPSPDKGLRSADESDAYVRSWFAGQFGLDTTLLSNRLLDQEDPEKNKSRVYHFNYEYLFDGRHLKGFIEDGSPDDTGLNVVITDEGIVHAIGSLWRISEKEDVDIESILTSEKVSQLNRIDEEILIAELCYAIFPVAGEKLEVRPIWYIITLSNRWCFDAFTGERY